MTLDDRIKILDRKIKQNEAQYDAVKMSAFPLQTWINMNISMVKI